MASTIGFFVCDWSLIILLGDERPCDYVPAVRNRLGAPARSRFKWLNESDQLSVTLGLVSSFVSMKLLESAPRRYDWGIRMLTHGGIGEGYECIARLVAAPGKRILDIGCGTGSASLACAARGAVVTGIDVDTCMLEVVRGRPEPTAGRVEFSNSVRRKLGTTSRKTA